MPLGIGGSGLVGIGFEVDYGTYVPPTKFVPVRSESLADTEDKQFLTPIRGIAGASYVKRGYKVIEGDLEMECTSDTLPYFLYLARTAITKTGVAAPFTYRFVPVSEVLPSTAAGAATRKTASLYVERAGQVFAYVGCSVTSFGWSIDNGDLIFTAHVMGLELETGQAPVAANFATWTPFGPGDIGLELPDAAPRTDIDTFTLNVNDNGEALNRIKTAGRGPSYIRWGEREVSGSFEHDFLDMSEYNAFNDNVTRTFEVTAAHDVDDSITILLNSLTTLSYPVNLPGLGDLVRASVDFRAVAGAIGEYDISVVTAEDIT